MKVPAWERSGRVLLYLMLAASVSPLRAEETPRLHLLLVGDTAAADIGNSVGEDIRNMSMTFACFVPHEQLRMASLEGANVTADNILTTIRKCAVNPSDTFVFFWSGHGAYDGQQGHVFQMADKGLLRRQDVRDDILKKRPRLCVLWSDTCATFIDLSLGRRPLAAKALPPKKPAPLFDTLFFQRSGVVDMNSCTEGQFAVCNQDGGLLTLALAYPGTPGRNAPGDPREMEFQPSEDFPGGAGNALGLGGTGFLWKNAQRRLAWTDLLHEVKRDVNDAFHGCRLKGVGQQRDQTVKAWLLPWFKFLRIESDDVIVRINGQPIRTTNDYQEAVGKSPQEMTFAVRDGRTNNIVHFTTQLRPHGAKSRFGVHAVDAAAGGGVRIVHVDDESPGSQARMLGIEPATM